MFVRYNFECIWSSEKREKISRLVSERIQLLVGIGVYEKIERISFNENDMIKGSSENSYFLTDNKSAVLDVIQASSKEKYELTLEKDILLSILKPGVGQSNFDNIIIKMKNIILRRFPFRALCQPAGRRSSPRATR